MLLAFLLVLSAVRINGEEVDQDGLRKSRQLDLGLQDIRTGDEEIPTTVREFSTQKEIENNGYLPPVSSSLSPDISSAQSQQTFDFKSVNSVEKESSLCKPPFDHESCQIKDSSASISKIPKPSRDLVPPFNDLEQDLANKATTLFKQANEEVKTTVDIQTTFTTTTAKPVTRLYKLLRQNSARFIKTTPRSRAVVSTAEATNELRSYLPPQPEFSAAAQTNVAVLQPANQNNHDHDHHHQHHHHHGENFNICDDPFHAFLCAPLKARKRITGALPSSLLGQSSYINYQKALKNFDKETASSNAVNNQYLPPKPSSTNLIQSSYLQPTTRKPITTTTITTTRPYSPPSAAPQSSNTDDKFYLPPLPSNVPAARPVNSPVKQTLTTVKALPTTTPSKSSPSTIKTSPTFIQNSIFENVSPTIPVFNSPSQENIFYLPPSPSSQPAASFVSNSQSIFPVVSTPISSTFAPLPTVTSFVPLVSNSVFVPQKPKVLPTIPVITAKPPAPVENAQGFSAVTSPLPTVLPTIQTTQKPVIPVSSFASQPSNPSESYLPPVSEFSSSSRPNTTTVKPLQVNFSSQPSKGVSDTAYLPPDPNEPAAAQISSAAVVAPQVKNPFHHGRDLCSDPFHSFLCTSAKPRKRITGQFPSGFNPESSNTNELRLAPEPSNQDESRIRSEKPSEGASAENVGYKYRKPINPLSTPSTPVTSTLATSAGYSYSKPDKIFPLPSQQDFKAVSLTTTKKPEPVYRASEAKVVTGYQYPKPEKIFPLPAGQDNNKIITTTSAPSTGYSYLRPQKPFPLPSEQKEIRQKPKPKVTPSSPSLSLPTNTFKGYQYPKPDQSLKLPEKKGYSYPKPDKRLELPTEARSKFKLPQTSNSDPLGSLGSADFIPVNKVEFKRAESSKLLMGLRRFGERMRKREREAQLYRKQVH